MSAAEKNRGSKKALWRLIPTLRQWKDWTLPSKLTAIGTGLGAIGLLMAIAFYVFPRTPEPDRPDVEVFLAAWNTKSDFELDRGGQSLLFVSIPVLDDPVNRLIFAAARLRPVNIGERSLHDLQVTTIATDSLWSPSLGAVEKRAVLPLTGADDFKVEVQRLDDKWVATRTIPRLDPLGGAPCPVFFVLEIGVSTPDGRRRVEAQGMMEIRVAGKDWSGVHHVVDIRSVSAASAEEFLTKCKAIARLLRDEGYPDVPVIFADTGGEGFVPTEGGPTVIQASIHSFFSIGSGRLSELL